MIHTHKDFVYPEDVAFAVGGVGQDQFALIEMHYDNPDNAEGTKLICMHCNYY